MKLKLIFLIIFLSIIPLFDLLKPGLPVTHDGQDHVARIANFYQNLSEGVVIPRWGANLNWGYGHPVLMFLYPLPSYSASLFHFIGFSLIDSTKIVFATSFILSGLFMFIFLRELLDDFSAFFGGLLYMFAPYRFVDLYVRGALGEHVAFIFLPLIFYFLLRLSKEEEFNRVTIVVGAISFAGLFLSHNAISIMFLPIAFFYSLFLALSSKKKTRILIRHLLILILGIGLSSFFLLPAFFEGKYTLRDIVTSKDYATRFTDLPNFFYGQWNYGISGQFTVQIGILHWLFVLLSLPFILLLYKKRNRKWIILLGSLVVFVATLIIMTPYSKFIWDKLTILQKFQFPWRFLSVSVFLSSVIGALVISQIKNYRKLLMVIFIVIVLMLNKDYWHAKSYLIKEESFFKDIYNGTTDTGESSPIWSVRFMEQRPLNRIDVIEGSADIKELFRSSTKHQYEIISQGDSRIRENTLYFPGWEVSVDGRKTNVEFQDPENRGIMTFNISKGLHEVSLEFKETKLRTFSDLISLFSIVLVSLLLLWRNKLSRLF